MKKKKVLASFALGGFLAFGLPMAAQNANPPSVQLPTETPQQITKLFNPGDRVFNVSLGGDYGLFNLDPKTGSFHPPKLNESKWPGATAALEWSFFVSPGFALGGDLSASVNFTPSGRGLFIVPLTFKASYFAAKLPWEFPFSLGFGPCITTVSDTTHVDMFIRPQAGVFYRTSPDWSFGGNLAWWVIPQVYWKYHDQDRIANFLQFSLTAMYHF